MSLYQKFCGSIYRFYIKYNESSPHTMVFWVTTSVVSFNALSILSMLSFFLLERVPFSKSYLYLLIILIGVINYIFFLKDKLYIEFVPTKKFNFKVVIYVIFSVITMIASIALVKDKIVR